MQQRRLRLGDILDDYCPRERRITNHAVVAMIEDKVQQTRCTTCDADHEYKAAKVPPPRRKRPDAAAGDAAEGTLRPRAASEDAEPPDDTTDADTNADAHADAASAKALEIPPMPRSAVSDAASGADAQPLAAAGADEDAGSHEEGSHGEGSEEEGPVHRRLIRATLPRPEGQVPERKAPDFTVRQPGGRGGREFDGNKPGQRFGQGRRPMRPQGDSQPTRFGGPRPGGAGPRNGSGQGRPAGNRPAQPGGPRGNRPGQGAGRGGGGRKRGR
ncbi:MAG TPA: hypothetical protein VES64_06290 [Allosphingosinicella sp.]|nr:hypothetical protein [Allosphingosinicella sp.]